MCGGIEGLNQNFKLTYYCTYLTLDLRFSKRSFFLFFERIASLEINNTKLIFNQVSVSAQKKLSFSRATQHITFCSTVYFVIRSVKDLLQDLFCEKKNYT